MRPSSPGLTRPEVLAVESGRAIDGLLSVLANGSLPIDVDHVSSVDAARRRIAEATPEMLLLPVDAESGDWATLAAELDGSPIAVVLIDAEGLVEPEQAVELGVTDRVERLDSDHLPLIARRLRQMLSLGSDSTPASLPADLGLVGLDNVEDVVYVFDGDGRLVWWSQSLLEVTGYSESELEGMNPWEFFEGSDRERITDAFARALEGEQMTIEARLVDRSGSGTPFEFTGTLLAEPHWGASYVCGIGRDISQRREREQMLQSMERQMETVFHDPMTFVCLLDTEGRVLKANDTALGYIDETVDAVEQELFWQTSWWSDPEGHRGRIEDAVAQAQDGHFAKFEIEIQRDDGARRTFDCIVRPIKDSLGEIVSIIVEAIDISERESLRTTLNDTLERISDALFAVDSEWQFTFVNTRALELTDRSESELIGETFWEAFPETLGTDYERKYRQAMAEQEPVSFEEYYEPLDMWTSVNAYPSESGLSVYYQDVTERRRSKEQRELLSDVISIAAGATSFEDALSEILAGVCSRTELAYGEAWIPDDDRVISLGTYADPGASEGLGSAFLTRTEEIAFERGEGLPGRVWASKELEWIGDLPGAMPDEFVRRDVVEGTGLRSAVGVPISGESGVVAVFVFFSPYARGRDSHLHDLVGTIAEELGEVMDRLQVREQLDRERAFQQQIFDTSPVGVAVVDDNGEIVRANKRLEETFRLSESEILDRTFFDEDWVIEDVDGNQIQPADLPIGKVLATGAPVRDFVHGIVRGDGTRIWLRVNATPLYSDAGEIEHVVASIQDITDQYDRKQRLHQQREHLSVIHRVLRHDLRSHVHVVMAYVEMLEDDEAAIETVTDVVEAHVSALLSTAEKTRKAIVYLESDTSTSMSVRTLLEDSIEALTQRRSQCSVAVHADSVGQTSVAAGGGLELAIVELLENAVRYGGAERDVIVDVERVRNNRVEIRIADRGPGIPNDELQVLESDVEDPLNHSSGIGIWLARWGIEQAGGELSISAPADGGTECRIELPIVYAE